MNRRAFLSRLGLGVGALALAREGASPHGGGVPAGDARPSVDPEDNPVRILRTILRRDHLLDEESFAAAAEYLDGPATPWPSRTAATAAPRSPRTRAGALSVAR